MPAINAPLPKPLIDELRKRYPPRCINPGESIEAAHRYAGAVELVDFLSACYERQHKKGVMTDLPT